MNTHYTLQHAVEILFTVSDFLFPSSFLVKKSYSIFCIFISMWASSNDVIPKSANCKRKRDKARRKKYSCIFFDLCIEPRVSWAKTNPNWLRFRSLTTREVCIKGTSYGEEANSWSQSVREPTIEVFYWRI